MRRAAAVVPIGLIARRGAGLDPGAVPGYDPEAPNVQKFRASRSTVKLGFTYLQGAIVAACVAFALDIYVGMEAYIAAPGNVPFGSLTPFMVGLLGLGVHAIVVELGTDADLMLAAADAEVFPDAARADSEADTWFLVAFAAILVGGIVGFVLSLPGGLVRLHFGPTLTPYGPTPAVLTNATAWCATGAVASVLIAFGLRARVKPFLPADSRQRWTLFFVLVVAASGASIALTFYGIYALGGNNPAGLGAAGSIAAMAVLWALVADAKAAVASRPEPAPLWPAPPVMVPVGGVAMMGLPVPMLVPGGPPMPPPALEPGPLPSGQAPPPARFCPLCGSPDITLAGPPARLILCGRCGRSAPY